MPFLKRRHLLQLAALSAVGPLVLPVHAQDKLEKSRISLAVGGKAGFYYLPLTIAGPQVQIGDARATGPGLGVTTTGTVDTRAATLDLEGTLAPAYGVNAVLGNIPLLGKVLVSREGEGIVGFTYTLDGPVSKPRAFVNPLSALAPGVLRRLFEGSGRAPAEADDAADKPRSGGNPNQR